MSVAGGTVGAGVSVAAGWDVCVGTEGIAVAGVVPPEHPDSSTVKRINRRTIERIVHSF